MMSRLLTLLMLILGPVLLVLLLVGVVALEVSIWNECRETNSFFYCMRVISK